MMKTQKGIMEKLKQGPLNLYSYIFSVNPTGRHGDHLLYNLVFEEERTENIEKLSREKRDAAIQLETTLLMLEDEGRIYCEKISEKDNDKIKMYKIRVENNEGNNTTNYRRSDLFRSLI